MKSLHKPTTPNLWAALVVGLLCAACAASSQTILTNIPVPGPGGGPVIDPAINQIYLWYGPQGSSQVLAINGVTFSQTTWNVGQGIAVDSANDNVWAATLYYGGAQVYAGASGSSLEAISLNYCPVATDVDASNRIAWVEAQCGAGDDPIWAIDADDYSILAGPIGCGGVNGGAMYANPATGRCYQLSGSVAHRVDPASNYALTPTAFGLVLGVNPTANLLYAQGPSYILQIVDGAPDPEVILTNVTLPFQHPANRVGVDSVRNRIYVPNQGGNTIVVLNATNGAHLGTVTLDTTITSVQGAAVDTGRNLIYALATTSAGSNHLYCIQGAAAVAQPLLFNLARGLGSFSLSWLTQSGTTDELEYTTSLTPPSWQPLFSFTGDGSVATVTDAAATGSQRYYRVVRRQ